MEVEWICQRTHLYRLLCQHPEWSQQQLADAVGCSKSMVNKWKQQFTNNTTQQASLFLSRSRAPRRHPPRISRQVVERILELRLAPPENLKRTPGPKALLYYLQKDEQVQQQKLRVPRSTRTVWRILDEAGLIERDALRQRKPLPAVDPLEEVQVDFKDVGTVTADPSIDSDKRQHLVEVCNFVDAGSSRLLLAQVRTDFHAETAFEAVVAFLRTYGLPTMLTLDRDVRWVGSASQRDFPSALLQFLYCIGVVPNVLPPHHPELNCYVERYHRTYQQECLAVLRPGTLEEARVATEAFFEHYNQQRPHQGRTCGNQPPAVAHPTLPTRPALPSTVDPDRWLAALDGRCYPRLVKRDGCVQVDGMGYYIKQALAGQQVLLRLMASTRSFDVLRSEQVIKAIPIKGLCGKELPLEAYLDVMRERARSEERTRVLREKRARLQGQHTT